jgi:hypothetical protein
MKGRWESNKSVWFTFMYSQNWNCAASLFPKQKYNVLSPKSYIHISVRYLYISSIVSLFCCSKYVDGSWEYINCSQTHECGIWDWGRAISRKVIHNSAAKRVAVVHLVVSLTSKKKIPHPETHEGAPCWGTIISRQSCLWKIATGISWEIGLWGRGEKGQPLPHPQRHSLSQPGRWYP